MGVAFWGDKNDLNLDGGGGAQLYEYTKLGIIRFKWVNFMLYELHFNKVVTREEEKQEE